MVISTLNEAEKIVDRNKNLFWDGWDIVYIKKDDYAEYLSDGFYNKDDQSWYRKSVYRCNENGWNIPDSVIK